MKNRKWTALFACLTSSLCLTGCKDTPGQKLDHTISSAKESVQKADDRYEDTKEKAKKKADTAREDLADKIRP